MQEFDLRVRTSLPTADVTRWCRNNLPSSFSDDFVVLWYPQERYYVMHVRGEEDLDQVLNNRDFEVLVGTKVSDFA